MKKAFLFLGLVGLFAACSGDDDKSSFDYSKLNRKWYNVSERVDGETFPYEDHEICGKDYVEFMANGTGEFVDIWGCDPVLTDVFEFDWTRSGDKITVTSLGETEQVTIVTLNDNTLEIKVRYDYDGDNVDDTVIERYTSNPN